ncbi:MAG TPA: hypothetical protein P5525_25470, partial [Candidatus Paceibacterota bacterium]|nr:hypothetical protein [Candidatus Paceibacterota bacterium]
IWKGVFWLATQQVAGCGPEKETVCVPLAGQQTMSGGERIWAFGRLRPLCNVPPFGVITAIGGFDMGYQCVATSVAGFIQQLAVAYVSHGYYFYVSGLIPAHKTPADTDAKIIRQYGIAVSKWSRARRKKAGQANVQYLRYGRFFVILATHGEQPFFDAEARQLRDIRVQPLHCFGYSIGCRPGRRDGIFHASVRIDQSLYRELKGRFEGAAVNRSVDDLCRELRSVSFEPYAPVRDQLRGLLRAINRRRRAAGCEPVPATALRNWRSPVKPFAEIDGGVQPTANRWPARR